MIRREDRDETSRRRLLESTGRDFTPAEARRHVRAIEARQAELERALGREVRFEVAALDYLTGGVDPIAPELRIVDGAHMDRLHGLARTDALTGALNRRGLEELLESETARASRTGEALSLLALDVDGFKTVNDRHGHLWGDHVLRRLSEILAAQCRASDRVARLGGDEFVVVLSGTDAIGARCMAHRLQDALDGTNLLDGCPTRSPHERVTVSIGVASGLLPRELVAQADSALYAAKRGGRNRWVVAS
jgi:diguanylate cyclase (GGDEF)-like protein